jgi:hypothetical protein
MRCDELASSASQVCITHTSAYVSTRQHTSAYVSIRQRLSDATSSLPPLHRYTSHTPHTYSSVCVAYADVYTYTYVASCVQQRVLRSTGGGGMSRCGGEGARGGGGRRNGEKLLRLACCRPAASSRCLTRRELAA